MKIKDNSRLYFSSILAAISLTLGLSGAPAIAQSEAQDTFAGGLEEVVVTAQRREESLLEVPMAMSVFSPGDMRSASITNTQNLSLLVPGLVYPASDNFAQPYIRGVGMAFAANGLEVPIATYIDDVYIQQQTGSITQLVDLERVEVLKGPQGTLYGRNATGGAIVVRTKNPVDEFEGSLRLGYGSFDQYLAEGVVNVPISGTVSFRFAGQYNDRTEGYIENVATGNDLGEDRRVTGRAKIAWRPSDRTEVVGTLEVFRGDDTINAHKHGEVSVCTACTVFGLTPPEGFYKVFLNRETEVQSDADLGILHISHSFNSLEFFSVTSYREYLFAGGFDQDFTTADLLNYVTRNESETFQQEFRLSSTFQGSFNFAAGVFYEQDETDAPATLPGVAFGGLIPGTDHTYSDLKAMAVFGELYYEFGDHWKLTVGGRFNRDERSLEVQNNADGELVFGTPGFKVEDTFEDFTPRVVLAYNDVDMNLYASYGEGFKSGGFNSVVFTQPDPLKSEELTGFEVGGKFSLYDRRIRLNTSIFHYSYGDMQVTFYDPLTSSTFLQNAADSTISGADFDFTWAATDGLTLGMGGSFLDTEFDSFPNGSIYVPAAGTFAIEQADLSGEPLPNAPEWSGYLSLNYQRPLGSNMELNLGTIVNFSDEYDFVPAAGGPLGLDAQDSLTRVNATAGIGAADQQWGVMFWIENLTDEEYFNNRLATGFGDQLTMALPRTFGATVEWNF